MRRATSPATPPPSRARARQGVRRLAAALLATSAAVVTLGVTTPAPASAVAAPATSSGARAVAASFDDQVLAYTNVERRKHGLRPLAAGSCLDGFAQRWTSHMATADDFNHQSLRAILRTCPRRTVGENIAWAGGSMTAKGVVTMWMNSPGHRHNILNPRFTRIGIDAYTSTRTGRLYVTQDFGG